MTTKKIMLIIGAGIAVLGLIIALFIVGIVWATFSTIGRSEAAQTSKTFLRQNEKLKSDIGEVRDFGFWVTGSINSQNTDGEATLNLKAIGARKSVPASVNLAYRKGRSWVVVAATYTNDAGEEVNLLNPYVDDAEAEGDGPQWAETGDSGGAGEAFDEEYFAANVSEAEGTTLLVFLSQSSLDSRALEKTLDELSADYAERVNLVRYSVDELPVLYNRFRIKKLPVVIIYKDGAEQERRAGALSKRQLAGLLDKYLETE